MLRRPQLEGIVGRFENKPLLGFVSTMIGDYMPLVDDYYFCTCCQTLGATFADLHLPADTS